MRLFEKKDESSTKKVQSIETARKAAPRPSAAKPAKPRKVEKAPKKSGGFPTGWIEISRQYLREVVFELRKVVWPSRKETVGSTAVVLVIVGLSALFLGVVDFFLSRLVRLLIG
ncbi:MAG: preprotein translocase subunit SecE [Desulfobacteraceae bacterium]|nr:preprotein translocase subunit SecE [Desulfobacteraceae bacterium]